MANILVADIMTREPVSVKPDTNLLECARKIINKKVGSLLIIDGKRLAGFVSQSDILWALVKKSKKDQNSQSLIFKIRTMGFLSHVSN